MSSFLNKIHISLQLLFSIIIGLDLRKKILREDITYHGVRERRVFGGGRTEEFSSMI
jgi:hypothetical protein